MFSLRTAGFLIVCLACLTLPTSSHAQSKRSSASSTPRIWTDATGKYKIRAKLVEVENGTVHLKRTDVDADISIPLEKLSKADQEWVAKHSGDRVKGGDEAKEDTADAPSARAGREGEWPWWLGTNHDGKSTDKGLLKQWPQGGPKLLWKANGIGKGFSSVAVSRGAIYITGDENDRLTIHAFDTNGKEKWHVEHGGVWSNVPGARSTPSVDGNNLYVLSGTGLLGCFDVSTGTKNWESDAKQFGGSPGGWGYAESPLVWGGLVIFKPGGQNCIVALDKKTGHKVWSSRGFEAGPEYGSCLPIYQDNLYMLITGTNTGLICVNGKTGALLWGNKFSEGNTANCPTPAFSDGYVFWANGYGKGGICLKLGRGGKAGEAWTTHDMVCHHGGYVIDNGYIYGNHEGEWVCLELKTGRKMWAEKGVGKGSLCWADGMLYLFSENGGRAALATCSPRGLKLKGEVKVQGEGPSWAHPVVTGGRLYLRYDDNLYCFDVKERG